MTSVVNINDVLDGHVGLDLACIDRLYLNAYVPNLQVGGQVVTFLTETPRLPDPVARRCSRRSATASVVR